MALRINPLHLHRQAIAVPSGSQTVLMLSMRNVSSLVGYCPLYEFEDLTAETLDAAVAQLDSMSGLELGKSVHKYVRYLTGSAALASGVRPNLGAIDLDRTYDMFLPFFNHPHEIFALNGLRDWRKRCRFAACYLAEAWETLLPRYQVEMLRDFDHIFLGVRGAVSTISKITGRPCSFVPMGVDTLRFCPWATSAVTPVSTSGNGSSGNGSSGNGSSGNGSNGNGSSGNGSSGNAGGYFYGSGMRLDTHAAPERVIRVCGIGRRSEVTHRALLDYANRTGAFYYYDTLRMVGTSQVSFAVTSPREHRMLLANVLKRSRYFIANRAFADRPALTGGKEEIPARFYEGAAAGTIMLGNPPETEDFYEQFGWEGAVIRTPFHAAEIANVLDDLERDPTRTDALRKHNVTQALLHHDWVYRLRTMLETVGLRPTEGMRQREERLRNLAAEINTGNYTEAPVHASPS